MLPGGGGAACDPGHSYTSTCSGSHQQHMAVTVKKNVKATGQRPEDVVPGGGELDVW